MTDSYEDKITDAGCLRMRAESGRVDDFRPAVALFYELARDHVPMGDIEGVLSRVLKGAEPDAAGERGPFQFTNGWLAKWAQNVVDRLGDAEKDVEAE